MKIAKVQLRMKRDGQMQAYICSEGSRFYKCSVFRGILGARSTQSAVMATVFKIYKNRDKLQAKVSRKYLKRRACYFLSASFVFTSERKEFIYAFFQNFENSFKIFLT